MDIIRKFIYFSKYHCSCFFKVNKGRIICLSSAFLLSAIVGVALAVIRGYTTENVLIIIHTGIYSSFKALMLFSFYLFLALAICYCGILHIKTRFLTYFTIIYIGYRFGILIIGVCSSGWFLGVMALIFYYLPLFLMAIAGCCITHCLIYNYNGGGYYYKCSASCRNIQMIAMKRILICFIILFFLSTISIIFFPLFVKIVIVI